jgi:hypothetical protein
VDGKFLPIFKAYATATATLKMGNAVHASISVTLRNYYSGWFNFGFRWESNRELNADALLWVKRCCKCLKGSVNVTCESRLVSNTGGQVGVAGVVALYSIDPYLLPAVAEGWAWAGKRLAETL